MQAIGTLIIGGGQAGLAMSHCLAERRMSHVVLERGRIAERWRSERWDSLRLLTPNWMSRLPGWAYRGSDPDGYMTMPEVTGFLEEYARSFSAPVREKTAVLRVEPVGCGYRVQTNCGAWRARNVVIATGYCDVPYVPETAGRIAKGILQLVPGQYRNPDLLPNGGVLVVGASASGLQLADEIHSSGRPVTLAVGRHTRLPRNYRGRDIFWWFERLGILDQKPDDVYDIEVSREQPSLQLVGRPDHRTLDLPRLQKRGVRLVGRVAGVEPAFKVLLDDSLIAHTTAADVKMAQLLRRIDEFVLRTGLENRVGDAEPFEPFFWPAPAPAELDLQKAGIKTILWATGFTRRYPWLDVPVLDDRGEIKNRGGVTPVPGLYVLGMQFLRHRKSAFIDGVGQDASALASHMQERLKGCRLRVA